ncbi:MAG: HEAT repeat domain-containing protein, partial [Candidatus Omnitrophota bacterium]
LIKNLLEDVLQDKGVEGCRFSLCTKDGGKVFVILDIVIRRDASGNILGAIFVRRGITDLEKTLYESDLVDKKCYTARGYAQEVLEGHGALTTEHLLKKCKVDVKDEWPSVRKRAVKRLGEMGAETIGPEGKGYLEALLEDKDYKVRHTAAEALRKFGLWTGEHEEKLLRSDARHHPRRKVRDTAINLLKGTGKSGPEVEVDKLIRDLMLPEDVIDYLKFSEARQRAASALGELYPKLGPEFESERQKIVNKLITAVTRDLDRKVAEVAESILDEIDPKWRRRLEGSQSGTSTFSGFFAFPVLAQAESSAFSWIVAIVAGLVVVACLVIIAKYLLTPKRKMFVKMLESEDAIERKEGVKALGELRDRKALENVLKSLSDDKDTGVRIEEAEAVAEILKTERVVGFGSGASMEVIEALENALMDPDRRVRATALDSMLALEIDPDEILGGLTMAFYEKNSLDVREDAAVYMGALGGEHPELADRIISALSVIAQGEKEKSIRKAVVDVYARFEHPRASGFLLTILAKDEDPDIRCAAAEALGKIDDPRTMNQLAESMSKDKDPPVRKAAAEALAGICSHIKFAPLVQKKIVPAYISALNDPDKDVRGIAAESLSSTAKPANLVTIFGQNYQEALQGHTLIANGEINNVNAGGVPALVSALRDNEESVRDAAKERLGEFTFSEVGPHLVRALHNPEETVRFFAVEVLGKFREKEAIELLERVMTKELPRSIIFMTAKEALEEALIELISSDPDSPDTDHYKNLLISYGTETTVNKLRLKLSDLSNGLSANPALITALSELERILHSKGGTTLGGFVFLPLAFGQFGWGVSILLACITIGIAIEIFILKRYFPEDWELVKSKVKGLRAWMSLRRQLWKQLGFRESIKFELSKFATKARKWARWATLKFWWVLTYSAPVSMSVPASVRKHGIKTLVRYLPTKANQAIMGTRHRPG